MADVYTELEKWGREQDARRNKLVRSPVERRRAERLAQYCTDKGQRLLRELDERRRAKNDVDLDVQRSWERGYDLDLTQPNKFVTPDPGDKAIALNDAARMVSASGGILKPANLGIVRVTSKPHVEKDKFTSETAIDPLAGVLVVTQNFKDNDVSGKHRLQNSDLLFSQWKHFAKSKGVAGLKQIWQYSITNPVTVAVIEDCLKAQRGRKKPSSTFPKSSRQLAMLCRTPNGKGFVRMLTDHAHTLGFKGIKEVTVLWSEHCFTWHLCFELEEASKRKFYILDIMRDSQ